LSVRLEFQQWALLVVWQSVLALIEAQLASVLVVLAWQTEVVLVLGWIKLL
jgi:hypothetical protein